MDLKDSIKISFIALKANKTRSALTMLGIVIGIGAVILMMSLGKGAESLILGQIQSLGSNSIYIEPGSFDPKGGGGFMESALEEMTIKTLTLKDIEAIKNPHPKECSIQKNALAFFVSLWDFLSLKLW